MGHVPPPLFERTRYAKGAYDAFGPGTRVPAPLIAIDHADHDTTFILKLTEERFAGSARAQALALGGAKRGELASGGADLEKAQTYESRQSFLIQLKALP